MTTTEPVTTIGTCTCAMVKFWPRCSPPRVLLLTATLGSGHLRAAQAVVPPMSWSANPAD